jgi:hypothetical protein
MHLPPISTSSPFSQIEEGLITEKWLGLEEVFLLNTNSKQGSAYRMVELLLLGDVICTVKRELNINVSCIAFETFHPRKRFETKRYNVSNS